MNFPDRSATRRSTSGSLEGQEGVVGITDFAQDSLGDVVFVELPAVGATLTQGQTFGVVESNKTVSDLFAPVSGKRRGVNETLREKPEQVNSDPVRRGWMLRIALATPDRGERLLDAKAYQEFVASEQAK
jgi:glycine cleavage system H protein